MVANRWWPVVVSMLAGVAAAGTVAVPAEASEYGVTPLGGPNGSQALAVGTSGVVVGCDVIRDGLGDQEAVTWSNGVETNLATGPLAPLRPYQSCATSINSHGVVAGSYTDLEFDSEGFIIDAGKATELPLGGVLGINDDDQAVGILDSSQHAYIWTDGTYQDLGTLGGSESMATATYAHNQAVGWAELASGAGRAFLYQNGHMRNLGVLPGGLSSTAWDVNGSTGVVGAVELPTRTGGGYDRAFLWRAGKGMIDLGTLGGQGSYATTINNAGTVAGRAQTKSGAWHLFLWTASGGMVDLNRLASITTSQMSGVPNATGINWRNNVTAVWEDPTAGNVERGYLIAPNLS